jgi:queuine/archaeosine tRNA-ribosyltransferase
VSRLKWIPLIQLGNWRGRSLDKKERTLLNECKCPGCQEAGIKGLSASGTVGFARRATHNLHVLLEELNEIDNRLMNGSYHTWYSTHVFNGMFLRLIDYALKKINMK